MSFSKFFVSMLDTMEKVAEASAKMSREERMRLEAAVIEKVKNEIPLMSNEQLRAVLSDSSNPRSSSGNEKLDLIREQDATIEKISKLKKSRRESYYSDEQKDLDSQIKMYESKLESIQKALNS